MLGYNTFMDSKEDNPLVFRIVIPGLILVAVVVLAYYTFYSLFISVALGIACLQKHIRKFFIWLFLIKARWSLPFLYLCLILLPWIGIIHYTWGMGLEPRRNTYIFLWDNVHQNDGYNTPKWELKKYGSFLGQEKIVKLRKEVALRNKAAHEIQVKVQKILYVLMLGIILVFITILIRHQILSGILYLFSLGPILYALLICRALDLSTLGHPGVDLRDSGDFLQGYYLAFLVIMLFLVKIADNIRQLVIRGAKKESKT
jgi:hypothetical protein